LIAEFGFVTGDVTFFLVLGCATGISTVCLDCLLSEASLRRLKPKSPQEATGLAAYVDVCKTVFSEIGRAHV
jgi:hypothetical protein